MHETTSQQILIKIILATLKEGKSIRIQEKKRVKVEITINSTLDKILGNC